MPRLRSLRLVASVVLMLPAVASAQMGGRGGGMGGGRRGGGGDGSMRERRGGQDAAPARPVSVVGLVLDHATELAITDSQRVRLQAIRRTLDSANAPLLARLDSLRPTSRPINPDDMSQAQRDEVTARRSALATVMEGLRESHAEARKATMDLLAPAQQQRAAELEQDAVKDAKKRAEDDARRGEGPGMGQEGGRGRGGFGGGGRPPSN
jgi:hypothetical protein